MGIGHRTADEREGSAQSAKLKAEARRRRNARIIALFLSGETVVVIAERLGLNPKTVTAIVREQMPGALTDTRRRA